MSGNNQALFGIPVVMTDAVPQGVIFLGRLPTPLEILEHGSLEAAIEAQKGQWAKIENVPIDDE